MIDTERLETQIIKDMEHYRKKNNIPFRDMAGIILPLGLDYYLSDMATRQLNGNKTPYLANWHLRQGIKYYEQDLRGQ